MSAADRRPRGLGRLATLLIGIVIGGAGMAVGLAEAGRLAPEKPQVLVPLAQTLEVEHRRVDLLVQRGDVAAAIAALESLRAQTWPTRIEGGDLAVQLKHDAYGRLVRLRLDHPDVSPKPADALLTMVDEGLGEDVEEIDPNPFTARLFALEGELLEELGRDDEALTAYETALSINRTLLERELSAEVP